MKLSDRACKGAKTKEKQYKISDGGGLYLLIRTSGSKLWQMKYRYLNKEKTLSIGQYPIVSLAQAREERDKAKRLLAQNPPIDPMAHKKENKSKAIRNAQNTFKVVALEWHDKNRERWSKNYAYKVMKGLELNVFPFIGERPIKDITPKELLNECLRKPEKRGSLDIAHRTKQICGQIFRYGIQTGRCDWNAAENLQGALKTKKVEHYRTIDLKELPSFINALERNEARLFERTRRAVWLSLYTFCRPKEIRMARWENIDFEEKTWIIPAEYMKSGRDHVVPMSRQVIDVFKEQYEEVKILNTPWVFPSLSYFSFSRIVVLANALKPWATISLP